MALLIIGSHRAQEFYDAARRLSPERDIQLWPECNAPGEIEHALAWHPPKGILKTFANLQSIVSVGAGVDHLFEDKDLPKVPIVRYVDPDLTGRMSEYIALHTLYHARRMMDYQSQQRRALWHYLPEPAAEEVRVGIMGLGVLGLAAAKVLSTLGYQVRGWSRSLKHIEGIRCFAGQAELEPFLAETDILCVLLPLTPDTQGILNRDLFQKLSTQGRSRRLPGPAIVNAGRGKLQNEVDILDALEAGEIYSASLDVFENEPLSPSSPLWQHPRIAITPHSAAESTTGNIVSYFLRHVSRAENNEPYENVVDRIAGY
ncbi:MAG: 2-hydroxyacid dehydrogenase [Hyphomicrobiaceae bacterium]